MISCFEVAISPDRTFASGAEGGDCRVTTGLLAFVEARV